MVSMLAAIALAGSPLVVSTLEDNPLRVPCHALLNGLEQHSNAELALHCRAKLNPAQCADINNLLGERPWNTPNREKTCESYERTFYDHRLLNENKFLLSLNRVSGSVQYITKTVGDVAGLQEFNRNIDAYLTPLLTDKAEGDGMARVSMDSSMESKKTRNSGNATTGNDAMDHQGAKAENDTKAEELKIAVNATDAPAQVSTVTSNFVANHAVAEGTKLANDISKKPLDTATGSVANTATAANPIVAEALNVTVEAIVGAAPSLEKLAKVLAVTRNSSGGATNSGNSALAQATIPAGTKTANDIVALGAIGLLQKGYWHPWPKHSTLSGTWPAAVLIGLAAAGAVVAVRSARSHAVRIAHCQHDALMEQGESLE